jgi:hypothetical protein
MGQAVTCQLCPICQGLTLLRAVRPETVDRLADLAGAVTEVLRDLAAARRTGASPSSGDRGSGSSSRVQDIPVADDDDPQDTANRHDEHHQHAEPGTDKSGSATP